MGWRTRLIDRALLAAILAALVVLIVQILGMRYDLRGVAVEIMELPRLLPGR